MSVLDEIIVGVREDLEIRKHEISLDTLRSEIAQRPPAIDVMVHFTNGFGVIAEVKRSSPSKGALAPIDDPAALAQQYQQGGACAVSVLTEGRRFHGSLEDLKAVRAAIDIPILRKEFIIDEYQIIEARAFGADLILLIVAALTDQEIIDFSKLTHSLGMRTLIEVHEIAEMARVKKLVEGEALDIDLLGINARNLKTLEVDPGAFAALAPLAPAGTILIAESGISSGEEVAHLAAIGAAGVLVGEALVKDGAPAQAIAEFLNRADQERVRRLRP